MNEIEKALRSVRPEEPSSSYLERGLARIDAFRTPSHLVSPGWRYATIGLTCLFVASLGLNLSNWMQERRETPADVILVSSELRKEGDLLIRETHYEKIGENR